MAQVSGVEPDPAIVMAAQGIGRLVGVVHIAQHDRRAGDADLSLDVGAHLVGGAGLHDLIVCIREGHADGALPGIVLGGQAGGGDALGGAVALPDLLGAVVLPQESVHLLLQLRAQAVAAGEDALQEAQVRPLQVLRPQQRLKEGRHAGDQVGLLLHKGLGVDLDVELGDEDAGAAGHQGGVNADAQAEAMEHRHDGKHLHIGDLLHGEAGGGNGLQGQGVKVQVGQHNALGGAGGAAGIEDGPAGIVAALLVRQTGVFPRLHHVVPQGIAGLGQLLHRPGRLGQGVQGTQRGGKLVRHPGNEDLRGVLQLGQDLRHLVVELVQGQDGLALGEVQVEGDLLGGGQGVDHIGDGPNAVQGIEAVQCLGGIGHADGHLVPLADAHFVQTLGGGLDALHKFRIGGLLAHEHIGHMVRMPLGSSLHHFIHGFVGIFQRSRCIPVIFQPGCGGR